MGLKDIALNIDRRDRVVSVLDDAIDKGASDVEEYGLTRDLKHLTLHENPEDPPVWFTLRPISEDEFHRCVRRGSGDGMDSLREVFVISCTGIEGLTVNGEDMMFRTDVEAGSLRRMSERVSRAVPISVQVELGAYVMSMSGFSDRLRKNSSAPDSTRSGALPKEDTPAKGAKSSRGGKSASAAASPPPEPTSETKPAGD